MKQIYRIYMLVMMLCCGIGMQAQPAQPDEPKDERPVAKKVLVMGDSMTGWLAERLNAYGKENGFTVSAVIWDGSTIKKWADSTKVSKIVTEQKPDVVLLCLGMNSLFEKNPEARLSTSLTKLLKKMGDVPVIWIGPPSWPGHKEGDVLSNWLAKELGSSHYFRSLGLNLARQSKRNPHPTREGMIKWADALVEWVKDDGCVALPGYAEPNGDKMSRPKVFIYKRMKETL